MQRELFVTMHPWYTDRSFYGSFLLLRMEAVPAWGKPAAAQRSEHDGRFPQTPAVFLGKRKMAGTPQPVISHGPIGGARPLFPSEQTPKTAPPGAVI